MILKKVRMKSVCILIVNISFMNLLASCSGGGGGDPSSSTTTTNSSSNTVNTSSTQSTAKKSTLDISYSVVNSVKNITLYKDDGTIVSENLLRPLDPYNYNTIVTLDSGVYNKIVVTFADGSLSSFNNINYTLDPNNYIDYTDIVLSLIKYPLSHILLIESSNKLSLGSNQLAFYKPCDTTKQYILNTDGSSNISTYSTNTDDCRKTLAAIQANMNSSTSTSTGTSTNTPTTTTPTTTTPTTTTPTTTTPTTTNGTGTATTGTCPSNMVCVSPVTDPCIDVSYETWSSFPNLTYFTNKCSQTIRVMAILQNHQQSLCNMPASLLWAGFHRDVAGTSCTADMVSAGGGYIFLQCPEGYSIVKIGFQITKYIVLELNILVKF